MSILFQDRLPNNEELHAIMELRAEELFKQGYNCCESMLKSGIEALQLPLPENTYLMGRYFREGIAGSGCICGALAGGMMLLGFVNASDAKGLDKAEAFRRKFIEEFGSTCCRVIRKKQNITQKFRNKKCREITRFSAACIEQILKSNENNEQ